MTNRTVQFWGQGYSTPPAEGLALTPCTITATVDGNVVFSGAIPTSESSDILRLPTDQQVLFTFEIPLVAAGPNVSSYTLPVSLAITGDDVYLEQILANYTSIPNPVFSAEQSAVIANPSSTQEQKLAIWEPLANPALTSEEITVLSSTNPADYQAQYDILVAHGIQASVSTGPGTYGPIFTDTSATNVPTRTNVVCTNAVYCSPNPPAPDERPSEAQGIWGYEIETAPGQTATFTFDMNVSPGRE